MTETRHTTPTSHMPEMADTWVSPLVEVERAVQLRAKDISLDMASPEGGAALRRLIDEEVARWSDDYKRSLRTFDLADPAGVAERAERNLAGYGPLAPLLDDDDVWEIMIVRSPASVVRLKPQVRVHALMSAGDRL
ncbi:MAG: hypothetical protein H0U41_01595 [Actinobacteria bacterium]|nr:hypothetical protein [Actinomycetota bacterium]